MEGSQIVDNQVNFTPLNAQACARCQYVPSGKDDDVLVFLHPLNADQPGRYVCKKKCYPYYMAKTDTLTTIRRPHPPSGMLPPNPEHRILVHKSIAASQRGETAPQVQRLGSGSLANVAPSARSNQQQQFRAPMGPPIGFPNQGRTPVPAPIGFGSFAAWNGKPSMPALPAPSSSARYYSPTLTGYTPNHLSFGHDQKRRSQQAYAAHGGFVIVIEARATIMPMGKTTPKLVGDVMEVIDDVPVHIGANELKILCFHAIERPWKIFTNGFPLSIDDVILRDDKWARIWAREPDVDVISSRFFHAPKKTGGAPQFRTKKTVINIHIPNSVYDAYLRALEEVAEAASFNQLLNDSHDSDENRIKSKGKGKNKTRSNLNASLFLPADSISIGESTTPIASGSKHSLESPKTPPPSKKAKPCPPISPDSPQQWSRKHMNSVLTKQTHATTGQLGALFKNKVLSVAVYPLKEFKHMNDLSDTTRDWRTFCGAPRVATLMFDIDPKRQVSGAFKLASMGESSPALFKDPTNFDICVKQTFYVSKGLKVAGSTGPDPSFNVAHDARAQAKSLTMEVRCLAWGRVLLYMVYTFIRRFAREHGQAPFPIPQMRFVEACLASTQDGTQRDLFLIEERIREEVEGKFRKYINNGATIPTAFNNVDDQERAQFLAFSQHVQYWKTMKTVFVGDYQGGNTLLTDPQIMSSPEFVEAGHHLFADGNVATGFESFEIDHVCNKFCHFFQLRTDYDTWTEEDQNSSQDVGGFTKAMSISIATRSI